MMIKNWDKWQTYRKDRGTPPWIKVHRNLMSNEQWYCLTDAEKGQLISIWILAADKNGQVPDSKKIIQKMCGLDDVPNISKFIELGFLVEDGSRVVVNVASDGCHYDQPETETETECKAEEKKTLSGKKELARQIIEYLNEKAGRKYKPTDTNCKFIFGRLKEGYDIDDLKWVVDFKVAEWKQTDMDKYLRPATLFSAEKFNQYIGEKGAKQIGTDKHWSETATGITARGNDLGLKQENYDGFSQFRNAVFKYDKQENRNGSEKKL